MNSDQQEIEELSQASRSFVPSLMSFLRAHRPALLEDPDIQEVLKDFHRIFLHKLKESENDEEKMSYLDLLDEIQETLDDLEDERMGVTDKDRENAAERMRKKVQSSFDGDPGEKG